MIVTDSVQAHLEAPRPEPDLLPAEMQPRGRLLTDARLTGTIAPVGDGMLFATWSGDRGGEG